jgi:UDP-glucose 4-epimerase
MSELAAHFAGKRILITGGLGFIGSNLARRLVAMQAQVTLLDSLVPEYGGNQFNIAGIEDRVRVTITDVRDPYSMRFLVQGQDYLFNLAGQTSHLDSMRDPFTDLEINCRAQLSILEACRHNNPAVKIVFASTRQFYGRPVYLPVDERHPLHPVDVNGVNKMAGEWYHMVYNDVYGIRSCSLRLTNTYGPRMRVRDARQTFLGIWIRRVLEGRPLQIYGDGKQVRDFNFVEDVIDALLLAAHCDAANGQIFNLGGSEPISLQELAELLLDVAGSGSYEIVPFPADARRIDIGDYYADCRHIGAVLGWQPRTSLSTGLAESVAFYREHARHYWSDSP